MECNVRGLQSHMTAAAAEHTALEGELQAVIRTADEGIAAQARAVHMLAGSSVSRQKFDDVVRRLSEAEMQRDRAQLERDCAIRSADLARLRPHSALQMS